MFDDIQATIVTGHGPVIILYYVISFIISFWWVFAIIFGVMFLASILSSRNTQSDALIAENNRLLAELIEERKKSRRDR